MKEWKRNCPKCGKELTYKYAQSYCTAKNKNNVCRSCAKLGHMPWNKGVARSQETRNKISKTRIQRAIPSWNEGLTKETDVRLKKASKNISKSLKGKKQSKESNEKRSKTLKGRNFSEETRKKLSETKLGEKNPSKRPEVRKKIRLTMLKNIENRCGQISPNYNKIGCDIINWYNMYYGFNFQHAENGGEVCIDGYWPDGLDEKRKTIIEIDESHHFNPDGILKEKDIQRQKYLESLGYEFIRIKL